MYTEKDLNIANKSALEWGNLYHMIPNINSKKYLNSETRHSDLTKNQKEM